MASCEKQASDWVMIPRFSHAKAAFPNDLIRTEQVGESIQVQRLYVLGMRRWNIQIRGEVESSRDLRGVSRIGLEEAAGANRRKCDHVLCGSG